VCDWAVRGRLWSKLEKEEHGEVWCWRIAARDGAFLGSGCARVGDCGCGCGCEWARLDVGLMSFCMHTIGG